MSTAAPQPPRRTGLAIVSALILTAIIQFLYQLAGSLVFDTMTRSLGSPLLPLALSVALNGAGAYGALSLTFGWFKNANRDAVFYSMLTAMLMLSLVSSMLGFAVHGTSYMINALLSALNIIALYVGGRIAINAANND